MPIFYFYFSPPRNIELLGVAKSENKSVFSKFKCFNNKLIFLFLLRVPFLKNPYLKFLGIEKSNKINIFVNFTLNRV